MDFRELALRDRDDAGFPVQIKHYTTGEPMEHEGKPCMVIVRGSTSKSAAAAIARLQREMMEITDDLIERERLQRNLIRGALPFVAGFENCVRDGKPMTEADAEWWLDLKRWEVDLAKANDPDIPLIDKLEGFPFPTQILRAVEASKAALGNA